MKKARATPSRVRSRAKANSGSAAVEKYLANVPQPARATLQKVRAMIRSAAPPEATEAISYGIPAFNYHGMLVAYAAFAGHCSFFPASGELLEEFAEELQGYACSKGTIRFALDKPLPARLVQRLVKARVRKNEAKALGHDKAKKAH
jgi:uncharacterized protein YdhG (YjbR/CyaY superfamily)